MIHEPTHESQSNNGSAAGDIGRLTWDDLSHEERLALILNNPTPSDWCTDEALEELSYFRNMPDAWLRITTRFRELKANAFELRKAVDSKMPAPVGTSASAAAAPPPLASSLVTFQQLLALDLPERALYMDWLAERSLVLLYGPRGVGKTMALLGLSLSLATGTPFLKWQTTQAVGVLYIDGEMSLDALRQRTVALAGSTVPLKLRFLPSELVYLRSGHDLTLTCAQRRHDVEAILDAQPEIKVVILDNVSCLFSGISEDKKQDWEPINAWLIRLRHRGITVIVGHHAGKSGQQRGTSAREDNLDTVIALTLPSGHQATDGCHFHLRFEKARGVKGPTVDELDVRLDETPDGVLGWTQCPLEARRTARIKEMLLDGMPPRTIAEELKISASYVYRVKREQAL